MKVDLHFTADTAVRMKAQSDMMEASLPFRCKHASFCPSVTSDQTVFASF